MWRSTAAKRGHIAVCPAECCKGSAAALLVNTSERPPQCIILGNDLRVSHHGHCLPVFCSGGCLRTRSVAAAARLATAGLRARLLMEACQAVRITPHSDTVAQHQVWSMCGVMHSRHPAAACHEHWHKLTLPRAQTIMIMCIAHEVILPHV